jgi:hypothetical protein
MVGEKDVRAWRYSVCATRIQEGNDATPILSAVKVPGVLDETFWIVVRTCQRAWTCSTTIIMLFRYQMIALSDRNQGAKESLEE